MHRIQFSHAIMLRSEKEWKWCERRLDELLLMHENIETANENAGYLEASPFLGFQFELTPHRLLLYCLEQANMTHVALFCQEFFQTFRPAESIGIEYVHTCDQPITRAFSGEAIFIRKR